MQDSGRRAENSGKKVRQRTQADPSNVRRLNESKFAPRAVPVPSRACTDLEEYQWNRGSSSVGPDFFVALEE